MAYKKKSKSKKLDIGIIAIGIISGYVLITGHYPGGTPNGIGYIFKIALTAIFGIAILGILTSTIIRFSSMKSIKKNIKKLRGYF